MNLKIYCIKLLIILGIIIVPINSTYAGRGIPVFIQSQETIYKKIAREISTKFPKKMEILSYDILVLNGPKPLQKTINSNFKEVLKKYSQLYDFYIMYKEDVDTLEHTIDTSFLSKYDELELIAFGKYLEQNAVIIATLTVIEDKKRKVWNRLLKKWEEVDIALFQGNIFDTENKDSLFRFKYYFLIN